MIIRAVLNEDLEHLIWPGLEEWEQQIRKEFSEKDEKNVLWLVAEENGEILGQILGTLNGKLGKPYLSALRVKPEFRNHGVGTKLILEAEKELKKRGATIVTISVDTWNDEALRLYKELGYHEFGEKRKEHWTREYKGNVIEEDVELIDLEKKL